jgi:hypothetical protein
VPLLDTLTAGATAAARWSAALAAEVLLLPVTIAALREALGTLSELPAQVEGLRSELVDARAMLDEHVPAVSGVVTGQLAPGLEVLQARIGTLADQLEPILPEAELLLDGAHEQMDHIERTVAEVGGQLGVVFPELQRLLPELRALLPKLDHLAVDELQGRVRHLDEVVEDLAGTLTNVLQAIPGVRRSVTAS